MASADELRTVALSLPQAVEKPHFDRTSFRVDAARGKIFATLPGDADTANLKLTPEQQDMLCQAEPDLFAPVPNKWGESGWTVIQLRTIDLVTLKSALIMAWKTAAPEKLWDQLT
ncbi:MAG: MmcQ/YjbR family DNA-binding protein [Pseudomonadota bacterium]